MNHSDIDFILDDLTWSHSKIDTYDRCPFCFNLQYVKCLKGLDGAFGQYGGFGHRLLEDYANGKLMEFELSGEWEEKFWQEVDADFPPMKGGRMADSYYQKGLDYFNNFEGFDKYEILGVEQKYYFKFDKYNMVGIVDLELREKDTGSLIILDHKSKGKQDISRLTTKTKKRMVKLLDGRFIPFSLVTQLYLYAIPFKEKYGKYPDKLVFNMFKIQDWYELKFDNTEFEDSMQWYRDKMKDIYSDNDFIKGDGLGDFWCNYTCGQRLNCPYSDRYINI